MYSQFSGVTLDHLLAEMKLSNYKSCVYIRQISRKCIHNSRVLLSIAYKLKWNYKIMKYVFYIKHFSRKHIQESRASLSISRNKIIKLLNLYFIFDRFHETSQKVFTILERYWSRSFIPAKIKLSNYEICVFYYTDFEKTYSGFSHFRFSHFWSLTSWFEITKLWKCVLPRARFTKHHKTYLQFSGIILLSKKPKISTKKLEGLINEPSLFHFLCLTTIRYLSLSVTC